MITRWSWVAVAALCMAPLGLKAQTSLPAQLEAQILLRVLAYDRALERNGSGDLVIAVLYDGGSKTSNYFRTNIVRALKGSPVQSVGGRPLVIAEIDVVPGNVAQALKQRGAAAAYITPGMDSRLPALVAAAQESHVTTLGGNSLFARRGVSVSVDTFGGRPQVWVNLASARAAGADLSAALLKLATVIQ